MKTFEAIITPIFIFLLMVSACGREIEPVGPVPTQDQINLQDMEMYAFLHYLLNTYTNQEWGYGNEDPDALHRRGVFVLSFRPRSTVEGYRALPLQRLRDKYHSRWIFSSLSPGDFASICHLELDLGSKHGLRGCFYP